LSYPLRNFDHHQPRRKSSPKAPRRAVERLDEIEAIARATEAQCRSWQWLKNFTALRVGGPVAAIVYPSTIAGAAQLVHQLQKVGLRWRALGHGVSILAGDEVHDFVAISLRLLDERLMFDGSLVTAHAGYSLIALVKAAAERGLSGLENFAGITGSVGGALQMEAESEDCNLWRLVESVTIAEGGKTKLVPSRDLLYREIVYSHGQRSLAEDALILTATLKLAPGDPAAIRTETERREMARWVTAPDPQAHASRVFSDVSAEAESGADEVRGVTAGQIVDELGFKGKGHGGARVSETNAEYIVNEGTATADDVLALSDLIREQAKKLRGLNLKFGMDVWKSGSSHEGDEK
jgi:UDP-N-acetylmuramate dehydrogenase